MIQRLLVTIVRLALAALDGAIGGGASSKKRRQQRSEDDFFNTGAGSQSNIPGGKKEKDEAIINDAYKYFALERPATIEQVKKQYKKLSLRHHPDRNGGSQASQEAMQKVNACLQIIEKDLAGDDGEEDNDAEEDEDHHKTAQERRKEYEAMRKQMQKEMAEELQRQEERKKTFHEQKETETQKLQKQAKKQNLDSLQGRQVANEQFQAEQRRVKEAAVATKQRSSPQMPTSEQGTMNDLDDDEEHENNNKQSNDSDPSSSPPLPQKPKNPVMDCNTEEEVVALRMGLPEVALEIWARSYESKVKERMQSAYFSGEKKVDMHSFTRDFLQQPYDDDGNTLLHYANYFESYQLCAKLCEAALKANCLEDLLTKPNVHGDSPRVFAEIAQDDDGTLLAFYDSQLKLARIRKTQTQFIPAIQAAGVRIYEIVRNIDIGATTGTLVSFGLGHYQMKLHVVTTLVGMVLMKTTGNGGYDGDDGLVKEGVAQVTILVAFYLSWITLCIAVQWVLEVVMIELVLILAPFVLAGLVSKRRRSRGAGFLGGLIDLLLTPLVYLSIICRYMEPIYAAFANSILTPNLLIDRGFLVPYLLVVTELGLLGFDKAYEIVADAS